jgi:hypothetical protein
MSEGRRVPVEIAVKCFGWQNRRPRSIQKKWDRENREDTMEFDAAKLDPPVSQEQSADYWRERAECLEEWVCELLRKNQTLRMDLENEKAQRQ